MIEYLKKTETGLFISKIQSKILYSNIYPTRCSITQLILSWNCFTCFGWYHHPSSGANETIYRCPMRKGPNFGRVFLRSNYNDITQNTYIQSWMVTEILAREKCGLLWCLRTLLHPWRHTSAAFLRYDIWYDISLDAAHSDLEYGTDASSV
jgi:hypothetical protein